MVRDDDPRSKASVKSVEYLVAQWNRKFEGPDRWYLGLVQRDEVWKPQQRVDLLDSLLKEYPVGSILLGRSGDDGETTSVLVKDKTGRLAVEEVTANTWQILDGQQRMSTLAAIFSADEHFADAERGHMELDMTVLEGGIHWIDPRDPKSANANSRQRRVDLSGWSAFAQRHSRAELEEATHSDEVLALLLADLDDGFTTPLTDDARPVARARWGQLLSLWCEDRIPVLPATVRSPEQLLELFTRVNVAGTDVSRTDIYYAAIKTFWPQAEPSLQRIVARVHGLLDRFGVLEFASRFARVILGATDPINVDVDILTGPQGEVLRRALTDMCSADSEFLARLEVAATWLAESSQLGWGLHQVHRRAIAAVLGWAIASPAADRRQLMEDNATDIDAFLAGTTLFGYRSRLRRDPFDRAVLREAMAAGESGRGFPGVQIREVLREQEGPETFSRIGSFDSPDSRRAAGNQHASLVLSAVQTWPFRARDLHIEHIYATEAAKLDMRIVSQYHRPCAHPLRSPTINSLGNIWLLPSSTNESLGHDRPSVKFGKLNGWLAESDPDHPVPMRDLWSIDPETDEVGFITVEGMLKSSTDNAGKDEAMSAFQELVETRATRLVTEFVRIIPGCLEFAREVPGPGAEPSEVSGELAARLRLGELRLDFEAEGKPLPSAGLSEPLATEWSGTWAGRENQLRRVWDEVTQLRKKGDLSPKQEGANARSIGFAICRSVWVTPESWVWLGVRRVVMDGDPSPLGVVFENASTEVRQALIQSSLDEWVPPNDQANISIPIPIDQSLPERRAVDAVITFLYQLEHILTAKPRRTD